MARRYHVHKSEEGGDWLLRATDADGPVLQTHGTKKAAALAGKQIARQQEAHLTVEYAEGGVHYEREYASAGKFGGENPPIMEKRTPAKESDRIEGSLINKEGSAASVASAQDIVFAKPFETALQTKVRQYRERYNNRYGPVDIGELKAVARRGMGAYSQSHHPDASRRDWALARVNAYLNLRGEGEPENANYTQDNDLLPKKHPRSTRGDD